MTEEHSEVERIRDAAKQAREEAVRLREQARELERRLRTEAREHRQRLRAQRKEQGRERRKEGRTEGEPRGNPTVETLSLEGVRRVKLHQSAGQLTVRGCEEGEKPGVSTSADRATPGLSVSREGDTLDIQIKLPTGWLFRRRKGASTVLKLVPGPAELSFELGAGDIQLRDTSADEIRVSTGAGVIGSVGASGALEAQVGAGKVSVYSHRGEVTCGTGTGDALVDVAEAGPGSYRIDVGIGRADLRLPAGLEVHTHAKSGIGRVRIEYPDSGPGSPIVASVDTGIGEASIRTREPAKAEEAGSAATGRTRSPRKSGTDFRQGEELRILQLLEQGRITAAEAGELIAALHGTSSPPDTPDGEAS